ncbi:MAG: RNA polymerase sigma factor [Acidobacteriota bacterium]|nr:RNA polymerase sigma factor [Blastocatellia bacterium]MDW8413443.1 RNA polymerase sigma factor [Acidobacteriota bacterium]
MVLQKTDYELAIAAAKGDLTAFEELYRRHSRKVYNLCMRMTCNKSEAEDLTQEVFIQLYRRIGSYRGEAAFTTWLHRLAVNQVLMKLRKSQFRFETTTEDGELPLPEETEAALPLIDSIALDKAIASLPVGYRTIFILHDVEGYEHEEIAKILGISVGTSKSQLHKARLKLRKILRGVNS